MKSKMMFCIAALFLISLGLLASRSLGGGEQDNAQFKLALGARTYDTYALATRRGDGRARV